MYCINPLYELWNPFSQNDLTWFLIAPQWFESRFDSNNVQYFPKHFPDT